MTGFYFTSFANTTVLPLGAGDQRWPHVGSLWELEKHTDAGFCPEILT